MVKNGWGLIDHGTVEPGVYHKWFDELSKLTERFLHVDSDGIIFYSTLFLLLQTYLNKNRYCLEFDLRRRDLGFTTRFWIFMNSLLAFFTMTERNKNQCIYLLIIFLFFVLILSILLTIKPNNFRKFFRISKEHDWTSIFVVGVL